MGPRPVWTGAENLASTGIPYPDRPVRSQSLYELSTPRLLEPTVALPLSRHHSIDRMKPVTSHGSSVIKIRGSSVSISYRLDD